VSKDRAKTARRLETLKLQSVSGRAEALAEAQTLNELRATLDGEERREVDERIRNVLPSLVAGIEVEVHPLPPRGKEVDITIHLRSGTSREVRLVLSGTRGKYATRQETPSRRRQDTAR
jgi:hypothetical protein